MSAANSAYYNETTLTANSFLTKLLECPICLETCRKPIYMCLNGHSVCSKCNVRLQECPVCREPGALKGRSITLDSLCEQVLFPCSFKNGGCEFIGLLKDLDCHSARCEYGYRCVLGDCTFKGTSHALYEHVLTGHPNCIMSWKNTYSIIPTKNDNYLAIYKWNNEYFWLYFGYLTKEPSVYIYLEYIGPKENASNFQIGLKVTSADEKTHIFNFNISPLGLGDEYESNPNSVELMNNYFNAEGTCEFTITLSEPIALVNKAGDGESC